MSPERDYSLGMTAAPRASADFIKWFVGRHPPLASVLEEHLTDNDGVLFPNVFMADVTRHAADLARRGSADAGADDELQRLLEDLDGAILPAGQDDPVDTLIWVSFVENAQGVAGDAEEPLRGRLRPFPNLERALSHYE
jgi:hypothetical protein